MSRAVFMDIDNTWLDFDAAAQEGMAHCFEDAGLIYKPEMFSVFKEENDRIWKKIEQGILTMDDLPYVAMEMLFRKCLFYSAVPMEGAKEILDHLQGKYILCTASNGPYEQQICRLKKADMLKDFDHCFVSEKIGVDKPDVRFFERCLEQLPGIRAEECMIIGDSLTADIAGGQAACDKAAGGTERPSVKMGLLFQLQRQIQQNSVPEFPGIETTFFINVV